MDKAMNIRAVPEKLFREVKAESSKRGMTLREFVLDTLGKRVGVGLSIQDEVKPPRTSRTKAVVEEPMAEPVAPEPEAVTPVRVPWSHDPKTCTVYGCLMCKETK